MFPATVSYNSVCGYSGFREVTVTKTERKRLFSTCVQRCVLPLLDLCLLALKQQLFVLIFVTVYHDAFIENLLLRLILFTFRIKLWAPPPSNE